MQGHYRYCEALFSLGEVKRAIEANKLAQTLCKRDREGVKDLEQQLQKFMGEQAVIQQADGTLTGSFTVLKSCSRVYLVIFNSDLVISCRGGRND